ncbi:hypothetical protein K8I61_02275 [bacterium]|nr:hypothetical protein [bacterium]
MMRLATATPWLLVLMLFVAAALPACSCGDDDDDDDDDAAPDDDTSFDDDDADDDTSVDDDTDDDADDDTSDDDADDDTSDDDTFDDDTGDDDTGDDDFADDFVADWPQSNIEPDTYNEAPAAGPMREKAIDYDDFHLANHQPWYGSTVGTTSYSDDTHTTITGHGDFGDSSIWSGTYLSGQAFRYHVTGDAQAKTNALKTASSLSRHLHVTGRTGFIARYVAPQDPLIYPSDAWCEGRDHCHHIETGEYAGDWWEGNTSRDQYTGWFFGMVTAYDLIDDQAMRDQIADDVAEVLDELIAEDWWITDVDGVPTTAGPNVLPSQQLTWSLIGYHITGEERFADVVRHWVEDSRRGFLRLMNISFMNRYAQFYGNNLGHQNMYSLLRLGKVYLSPDDYANILDMFETQTHTFNRLAHNAFFNTIFMSQGDYNPADTEYQDQLEEDLGDFRDAPNTVYYVDPTDLPIDPVSVLLDNLQTQYPFLEELFGSVDPQSIDAHPVLEQCTTDFLWQRSPYRNEPCGSDNPLVTRPGVDYITAYWMASYHKFLTKDQ